MDYLLVAGGLVGLLVGGDLLVRGAVGVARRFDVSPMVIGLTLVGFGTSAPELVTSLQAALIGSPGIALGNIVGSNIANILLILGLAALISPMAVAPAAFKRDGTVLVLATLACVAAVLAGTVGRPAGGFLLAGLAAFLALTFAIERRRHTAAADVYEAEAESLPVLKTGAPASLAVFAVGLVITVLAARFLVQGAAALAADFGVSEAVIGLTVVAVGTSLPELATSAVAAVRRQSDVALGNVVGSNIFNVLGILGVTALVSPLAVPAEIARLDVWVMLAATALLVAVVVTGWRITRREGAALLAVYAGYIAFLAL
ncbi:calcium/sodium antiporter [Aquibium sp. A9E412]|uniref:calcium/sodium antiporter n=1 Tax=Aquibium sp. A9E412 TaxID=2976767 RepID=UPI0025AF1D87|nr:calcium/sodium antiporter [Aquibium sp. A9E412]MDN2565115.1 calcium/sodium antiporter [Aquibium sp. A9E412]